MIYIITNKKNNKQYIGKTQQNIEQRWYQHCKNAEYGHDTYLYRAIRKYGVNNFVVEKIGEGLDDEEILFISRYQPEYNMTMGGDGGNTSKSPNYRKAMSRRNYEGSNNPNYGKRGTQSPNYGKVRTQQQKDNIRNSNYLKLKRRPVMINGVQYDSVLAAAKAHNRSERWVRIHDEQHGSQRSKTIPLGGSV